jgi:PAS domain S-box-containing protein
MVTEIIMNKTGSLEKMSETSQKKVIKAADLDFYDLLQRQASEGMLFFNQRRAIIFDVEAMGALRQQMIDTVGAELAMGIMMRFGYAQGYQDAKILNETFAWQTDLDWLAAGPMLHILEGIVYAEPAKLEFNRETGHFDSQAIWQNSCEAEQHLKRYAVAKAPVCWTLTGYASGYCTYFFGQDILAIETECVGRGDERCYVEARPVETWGEEATTYRQALQEVNVSRQIQETNQQLQIQTQRLRESEQRFRSLYTRTPAMLHSLDTEGRIVEVSDAWLERLGYNRAEVIGCLIDEFMTKQSQYFEQTVALPQLMKTGSVQDIAYQFVKKDGQVIDILLSAIAQYDDQGQFIRSLGVLADVTERKRAEATATKRALELETVAGVSAAASTILDTNKLLWEVANLTKTRFNLYHAHIYLLNKTGDTLELVAGAGEIGRKMVAQGWHIPLHRKKSLVAQAARTRKGVIVNDVRRDSSFLKNPLLPDTRSELAVPMIVGKQLIGVLDVQAAETNRFTQEDAYIQTTLAAQVAISLENARLLEQAQTRAQREQILREVTAQIRGSVDVNAIMRTAAREIGRVLDRQTFIYLGNEPNGDNSLRVGESEDA